MRGYVLDASVAAKWVLDAEPYEEQADRSLMRIAQERFTFTAPDFFWLEIANVLWKAARRGAGCPEVRPAADLIPIWNSLSRFRPFPALTLREDALAIALEYNCAVYDAAYLSFGV